MRLQGGTAAGIALLVGVLAAVGPAPAGARSYEVDRRCAIGGPGEMTVTRNWNRPPAVRPTRRVRTAMIFVDFRDAPAGDTSPADLYTSFTERSKRWIKENSYGRTSLVVRPYLKWLRLPRRSSSYFRDEGRSDEQGYIDYIADAMAAADPGFDFSGVKSVYIVTSPKAALATSSATLGDPRLTVDGARMDTYVTFGRDMFAETGVADLRSKVLTHETGHLFSLPDLYAADHPDDIHHYAGPWDPMGEAFLGNHLSAWSKRKIGWLRKREFVCVKRGRATATIRDLARTGGRKAVFIRRSKTSAYIVESRAPVGFDGALCSFGVLVWRVSGLAEGIDGGLRVMPAHSNTTDHQPCQDLDSGGFSLNRAPHGVGEAFRDKAAKITVKVLARRGNGYRVRVRRG